MSSLQAILQCTIDCRHPVLRSAPQNIRGQSSHPAAPLYSLPYLHLPAFLPRTLRLISYCSYCEQCCNKQGSSNVNILVSSGCVYPVLNLLEDMVAVFKFFFFSECCTGFPTMAVLTLIPNNRTGECPFLCILTSTFFFPF